MNHQQSGACNQPERKPHLQQNCVPYMFLRMHVKCVSVEVFITRSQRAELTLTPSFVAFSRILAPKSSLPMQPKYEVAPEDCNTHCATRMLFCVAPPGMYSTPALSASSCATTMHVLPDNDHFGCAACSHPCVIVSVRTIVSLRQYGQFQQVQWLPKPTLYIGWCLSSARIWLASFSCEHDERRIGGFVHTLLDAFGKIIACCNL
jgi:hypothetical protein